MSAPHDRVVLQARLEARPGAEEQVAQLLSEYARVVCADPGTVAFEVYREIDRPAAFLVFEAYVDAAAFESHLAAEAGRVFNAAVAALLVGGASDLTFLARVVGE